MSAECSAGNIPSGYKQTEVGIIPEDWTQKTLGEFISLQRGHDLTECERRPGEVPVMGSAGQNGFHDTPLVKGPGVVLGRSGASFGQAHYCKIDFWPHNTALYVTDFRGNDQLFVFYFLKSLDFSRHNSGGAQQSLNRNFIAPIPVAVPPPAEQEAIAKGLSDADVLIESLEQLIAKKRQIKQGAMQELLTGKRRLPGFSGEWETKLLRNTAILKARIGWQGLTTDEYLDSGDYYLVTGTEFKDGYIDWSNCHYVTESRYKQDKNIQLKKHDVLVTKDGTIGKVALINHLHKPATLNSGVFVIRPIEDAFHPEFFYYLLCSNIFTEFLVQLSAGSTINHLYQKDFVNFTYKTPATIKEQISIATILSDMDSEITALEERLAKARQLKQGMMQELLTGRIRLV
ncbi:restriction endonuclease subunit S [Methanosarcina sp. DH2]|uniref:restriction endonuclease subunit S n=1 Tax=Methanosarcina sp. DH2 TaxID=2605639 RepID=UPI001E636569|nr:restriction endonuclease subunit S [Methanosarcina sp. DH2]MCC4771141.1 restriction endonuclease subunit S [Methanosarcina sp. DH2]